MRKPTKRIRLSVCTILCIAFIAVLSMAALIGCAKKDDRKLTLIEMDGPISIERGGEKPDAKRDMDLKTGDRIVTGAKGSARIRIDDDKFLYLGASTSVVLTAEGKADSSKTTVFVEKGSVMTEVKRKLNADSSFTVVTPNTSMAIRGTKTLTEVYEDVLGAIKTSAAVIEGQVSFKTVQINRNGKPVAVTIPVNSRQGFGVTTNKKDLLSTEDLMRITENGSTADIAVSESAAYEEQGAVLEAPAFSEDFLTNCVAVLARSREEDIEEGFTAENVTEEELNAAIIILNDVIDGKIILPASVEEYILSHSQPYYDDPDVPDNPVVPDNPNPSEPDTPDILNPSVNSDEPTEPAVNPVLPDEPDVHVHSFVYYDRKAATCTSAGYEAYEVCTDCGKTTYKEIPALGHDFGEWAVTTEPYPVYDGEYLSTWHAGEKTRHCSRCPETEKEAVLLTPVLMMEIFPSVNALPVDLFTDFGRNPQNAGMTLQMFGTELFWAASPSVPGKPFDWVGIDGAVIEWVEGGNTIGSLKAGDTIHLKVTIPASLKDVYADLVVPVTLTPAHEHVWGEGYTDPDDPSKLFFCCEICGETKTEDAQPIQIGE